MQHKNIHYTALCNKPPDNTASLDGHVIILCSYMWEPFTITSMLKVTSHFTVFYTVMIHFFQFMNFGSGVTFYKGQANVKSGHPLVRSAKSIVTTCKQILQNICTLKFANSVITVHHSKLRVLSLSQNGGPLTHNRNYICSVYTKTALTEQMNA